MAGSDDEDEVLAHFLESEILSEPPEQVLSEPPEQVLSEPPEQEDPEAARLSKKPRLEGECSHQACRNKAAPRQIETGIFCKIPPELFYHIFKFLSSEDLIACSMVCRFMDFAASDECLWRRLYCLRWGLASPCGKLRSSAWKKLYIQRDQDDMEEFVRNTPSEFKEYYIQMQAAKRSQTPLPSQVNDDRLILDRTVAEQVSIWRSSRGLTDEVVKGHVCCGNICSFTQIGDAFLCERTGHVHVCDDNCRETVLDSSSGIMVCTISGHCYDRWISTEEDTSDSEQQQGGVAEEPEPFMGSGRFAQAYQLGYECADEKELEAALRSAD